MINANFKYYKIDLADIWDFERSALLNKIISEVKAAELLHKIQLEITKNADAAFGLENYDGNQRDFLKYFKKKEEEYRSACKSTRELFRIEFFFSKNQCFQYDHSIFIEKHHPDFDYWFSKKIFQYHLKLNQLGHFLNFQENDSFCGDKTDFDQFLTTLFRQNKHSGFSKEIMESVNEWKSGKKEDKSKKTGGRKLTSKKMAGEIDSLQLEALRNQANYFQSNIHSFLEAFQSLKELGFIDGDTDLEQFKDIFRNKKINPKKRIKWIGSIKELQWFIKELMYESQKIENLKNDIWLTTASCFVDKNGNDLSDTQLRTASGKKLNRKDEIIKIVNLL